MVVNHSVTSHVISVVHDQVGLGIKEQAVMSTRDVQLPVVFVGFAIIIWWILSWYRSKDTPMAITLLIYVCWILGFQGLFLVPIDLADVQTYGGQAAPWLDVAWKFVYWSTFLLTWVVLPILYGFIESGYFTVKNRLYDALHKQIKTFIITIVALVLFVIYLLTHHYTLASVEGFMIALANTYGLLMIVALLGYGFVELPRRLWDCSFVDRELQRLYFRSSLVDSILHDAVCVLTDVEAEVASAKEHIRIRPPGDMDVIEAMRHMENTRIAFQHRPEDMMHGMMLPHRSFNVNNDYDEAITIHKLAGLHARLKTAQQMVQIYKLQRDSLIQRVEDYEAIAEGNFRFPEVVMTTGGFCPRLLSSTSYYLAALGWCYCLYVKPWLLRGLAICCCILSVCLLWSEVVLGSPLALSPLGALIQSVGDASPFTVELATALPLLYLSICTYRSLFKFRLFGDFHLQSPHQSFPRQLLVNAQYLIRLQFSLAYHFLLLLRSRSAKNTAFRHLMSNMTVVPILGTGFNTYAPLIMVVLAATTFFRGYARLLRMLDIHHADILTGEEQAEMIQQGKALARRRRYTQPRMADVESGGVGVLRTSYANSYRQLPPMT